MSVVLATKIVGEGMCCVWEILGTNSWLNWRRPGLRCISSDNPRMGGWDIQQLDNLASWPSKLVKYEVNLNVQRFKFPDVHMSQLYVSNRLHNQKRLCNVFLLVEHYVVVIMIKLHS